MDQPAQKPFKRSWMRFPLPEKQILLFLPTVLALGGLAMVIGFSLHRVQAKAVEALNAQGVSSEVSREFLQKTHGFSLVITVVSVGVGVAALLWVWWLSVWIFGPYRRLEKDLNEVLYGRMRPDELRIRKSDALYSLVERMRQAFSSRPTEPPKEK